MVGADNASKTENKAPWTLFGDNSGNYYSWTPTLGSYTLTGVPFSGKSGAGTPGTSHTVTFTIVDNSGSGCTTPQVSAGADVVLTCGSNSVTIDGSASDPGTYSWTGPNGFTSSAVSPSVSITGTYTLTVTVSGGCQNSDVVVVTPDSNQPNADAGSIQTIDCNNPTVTLDGSASDPGTYSWTGPNGFTSSSVNPSVSVAGVYTLQVTVGGCSGTDQVVVAEDTNLPNVDAGSDKTLDCSTSTITLDGSNSDPGTYSWTGPSGFTSSTQNPTVTESGTYTLTVTSSNGCSDSDNVIVSDCNVQCSGNAVTHFVLINAATDLPVLDPISDGATIDIGTYGNQLNIEAITTVCGTIVKSVVIDLVGAANASKTENNAPWTLFGDNSGNYFSWTPTLGSYTLTGTPYSGKSGAGTAGTSKTISFTIIDSSSPAPGAAPSQSPSGSTGGLGQNLQSPTLNVMPNPFQNRKFNVSLQGDFGKTLDIKVFSINGQLIYQEKRPYSNLFTIDLAPKGITDGVYQLRINNETKLIQSKSSQ